MQITVHVDGHYDWEPLPADAGEPTTADIEAKRVKPNGAGGWLMKVNKKLDSGKFTHTSIGLPESQIIAAIVEEMARGDHKPMTRAEAVSRYLARHVMPHHAHRNWMHEIEVSDSGPEPELFGKIIATHVEAGNIDREDVDALTEAYMDKAEAEDASHFVDHLHKHFGIDPKKHTAFRSMREANVKTPSKEAVQ